MMMMVENRLFSYEILHESGADYSVDTFCKSKD